VNSSKAISGNAFVTELSLGVGWCAFTFEKTIGYRVKGASDFLKIGDFEALNHETAKQGHRYMK